LESLIMNLNQTFLPKDPGRNYSNNWPNPKSDWTRLTRGQLRVREPLSSYSIYKFTARNGWWEICTDDVFSMVKIILLFLVSTSLTP
jgi:hypothetical protein